LKLFVLLCFLFAFYECKLYGLVRDPSSDLLLVQIDTSSGLYLPVANIPSISGGNLATINQFRKIYYFTDFVSTIYGASIQNRQVPLQSIVLDASAIMALNYDAMAQDLIAVTADTNKETMSVFYGPSENITRVNLPYNYNAQSVVNGALNWRGSKYFLVGNVTGQTTLTTFNLPTFQWVNQIVLPLRITKANNPWYAFYHPQPRTVMIFSAPTTGLLEYFDIDPVTGSIVRSQKIPLNGYLNLHAAAYDEMLDTLWLVLENRQSYPEEFFLCSLNPQNSALGPLVPLASNYTLLSLKVKWLI